MNSRLGVPAWLLVLGGFGLVAAAVVVALLGFGAVQRETLIRFRNATGLELSNVVVSAKYTHDAAPAHLPWEEAAWAVDAERSFIPRAYDLDVTFQCVRGGSPLKLATHVDVWAGETYLIEILPDFTLKGSYVSPPR